MEQDTILTEMISDMVTKIHSEPVLTTKEKVTRMGCSNSVSRHFEKETLQAFKKYCNKHIDYNNLNKDNLPEVFVNCFEKFLKEIKELSLKNKLNYRIKIFDGEFNFIYKEERDSKNEYFPTKLPEGVTIRYKETKRKARSK